MHERREVLVEFHDHVMAQILVKAAGVPAGSVVTGVVYDMPRRRLLVALSHPTFAVVPPWEEAPHVPVELR